MISCFSDLKIEAFLLLLTRLYTHTGVGCWQVLTIWFFFFGFFVSILYKTRERERWGRKFVCAFLVFSFRFCFFLFLSLLLLLVFFICYAHSLNVFFCAQTAFATDNLLVRQQLLKLASICATHDQIGYRLVINALKVLNKQQQQQQPLIITTTTNSSLNANVIVSVS